MLKLTGSGDLLVSSYGAIREIDLAPGQKMIVDTGHVVAFDETVRYEVHKVSGWKQTFLSGEGLVVHLIGPCPPPDAERACARRMVGPAAPDRR